MVCQKNVGLRKFWLDLKISEVFLIGLKVLFSGDFFASWTLKFFSWQVSELQICCFFFLFVVNSFRNLIFQSSWNAI